MINDKPLETNNIENYIFNAPINGQSLTDDYKNAPFERPPEISDPDTALRFHIESLTTQKSVNSLIKLMALGMPLKPLTETVLTSAVMEGIHSVDVSLVIAPAVYDYVKKIGDISKVDYITGLESNDQDDSDEQDDFEESMIKKALNKSISEGPLETNNFDNPVRRINPGFDDMFKLPDREPIRPNPMDRYKEEENKEIEYGKDFASAEQPTKGLMNRSTG
jgi:hypothetical protein